MNTDRALTDWERFKAPMCVLHSDRVAIGTAAHIPVCGECHEAYQVEGRKYLPMNQREVYLRLLAADEKRKK